MFKKNRKEKKNPGKILSKLISVKEKIQKKFREKFPKKKPRFHDADLHEKRYILRLAAMSFLMYLYIETFARATDGIFNGVMMLWKQPVVFPVQLVDYFCHADADASVPEAWVRHAPHHDCMGHLGNSERMHSD